MSSTFSPSPQVDVGPRTVDRFGHVAAILVNGVLLWASHQLLDWGWPSFLTEDFEDLLPLVTLSFAVGMAVNAVYLVHDRGRIRALGDLLDAGTGLLLCARTWEVFPFEFSGTDWSWLLRTVLVVGIAGSGIAVVVNGVKLVWGAPSAKGRSPTSPGPRSTARTAHRSR